MKCNKKVVLLTNIPAPYRVLLFNEIAKKLKKNFIVIYYRTKVSYRDWNLPAIKHPHLFLKENIFSNKNIHFQIFLVLRKLSPSIIITTGFSITTLFVYFFCKLYKRKFIIFTDSWIHSVNQFGIIRKSLRRLLIPLADTYICISAKGKEYLIKYGAKPCKIFEAPLAIDNLYFSKFNKPIEEKKFDVIFSGQFIKRKMPLFVIDVIREINNNGLNLKVLFIGSGPLKEKILDQLKSINIEYLYPGYIQQKELPEYYSNAKVLLFPSMDDPWGIIANEACAVGTPVITCNNTGVADELILHNFNGYVLPLEVNTWARYLKKLLNDKDLYKKFSRNSLQRIQNYNIYKSSDEIINSIKSIVDIK